MPSAGSQGSLCWIFLSWNLRINLRVASLQFMHRSYSERGCLGKQGHGSGAGFIWLPVAQRRPKHCTYSPLWLLSAPGTLWLDVSRHSHSNDALLGVVFLVLLPHGVFVCWKCLWGFGCCGPHPPIVCGTNRRNNHFCIAHFCNCSWGSHGVVTERIPVCRLLGLHAGPPQVFFRCNWLT